MHPLDIDILETILMQKNKNEEGHYWILGPRLFRVLGLSNSQMHASNVVLTNEFSTLTF